LVKRILQTQTTLVCGKMSAKTVVVTDTGQRAVSTRDGKGEITFIARGTLGDVSPVAAIAVRWAMSGEVGDSNSVQLITHRRLIPVLASALKVSKCRA
jgi:hypothetical protein